MRTLATALAFLALGATPALAKQPVASNLDKVLVIGTDGTRWDLLRDAMRDGRAPNLARLARQGFARPSKLDYGPNVLTLSEVGWSSIASGVWPDKHGVDGRKFNMDPKQATKNGYLDFLTRVQRGAPRLDTYLASDWANIGLPQNGGPIFGPTDDRFAISVDVETLAAWDAGDVQVTNAARSFLRKGNPDASFVYLGLVDETAHLSGSATPAYPAAITTTDARIGQILRAVRSRPSYPFESWTVIVTTDHGQRDSRRAVPRQPPQPDAARDHLVPDRRGAGPRVQGEEAEGRGHRADRPPPARAAGTQVVEARRAAALALRRLARLRLGPQGTARGHAAPGPAARRREGGRRAPARRREGHERRLGGRARERTADGRLDQGRPDHRGRRPGAPAPQPLAHRRRDGLRGPRPHGQALAQGHEGRARQPGRERWPARPVEPPARRVRIPSHAQTSHALH